MIGRFILVIIFGLSPRVLRAQDSDSVSIRNIANQVLADSRAYENLRELCKKIGPRLSGSANAAKAVEWGRRMMLEAGADTVYLQPCMVTHWQRGGKETGFVLQGASRHKLNLCALGNSVGTGTKGISASVIEVRSFEELQQLGREVITGKIVFFNHPMRKDFINTFEAYGEAAKYRVWGPSQAAKYGAVGSIVRSMAINIDPYPHTGVLVYNDSFPKIPAVAISTEDAEWLSNALRKKMVTSVSFTTNCRMLKDVQSYNVVGEIRGNSIPREIITVGGHLDSWDLAEGAQDDGAGCVQSIEVLRTLKKLGIKPERTIRAVLFMNEENGGGGGRAYKDSAIARNENHIFALESDEGGFSPRGFGIQRPGYDKIKTWAPLFYPYGVYMINEDGGGSDIAPLAKLGTVLAGLEPDTQRYFELHHASTDVFEAVSKRELDLGIVNMTALIWLVSKYGIN